VKTDSFSKTALLFGRIFKMAVVNPRGLREVAGISLAVSEGLMDPSADVLPIPVVSLVDLLSGDGETAVNSQVWAFPSVRFSISLVEALTLGMLARKCQATRIFEFGTHRGVSTTQLAANLPEQGKVFTLDLPRSDTRTHFEVDDSAENEVANFPVKGDLIPESLRKKITFLEQDSAKFDPAPYAESIDLIFVDAAHTREYVLNDSEKAWAMLKPGGILAWHDCRPQSPEVVKYLRACKYQPRRIEGTTLAFAQKPKK